MLTRRIIGIAGAPGAGKSSYAEALVAESERSGLRTAYVPMDGFHLADIALTGLGLLDRKGAPGDLRRVGVRRTPGAAADRRAHGVGAGLRA